MGVNDCTTIPQAGMLRDEALHAANLTSLLRRLIGLVGASKAHQLAGAIPKFVIGPDSTVLNYDRDDPQTATSLLIELYEVALGELALGCTRQASSEAPMQTTA
jgi:hypothetical protein